MKWRIFSRDHLEKSWVYVPHCVIISISVQAVSFQAQAIVCVFLQKPFFFYFFVDALCAVDLQPSFALSIKYLARAFSTLLSLDSSVSDDVTITI